MLKLKSSIRTRVLAIVLVPALVLAVVGVGAAWYLINEGYKTKEWAEELERSPGTIELQRLIIEERRVSLLAVAGDPAARRELPAVRNGLSQALAALAENVNTAEGFQGNPTVREAEAAFYPILGRLPQIQQRIDTRQASIKEVADFYGELTHISAWAVYGIATTTPDTQTAVAERLVRDLLALGDGMTAGYGIAYAATHHKDGLTPPLYREFAAQVQSYRDTLQRVTADIAPEQQPKLQALLNSDEFKTVATVESVLLAAGPQSPGGAQPPAGDETAGNERAEGNQGTEGTEGTEGTDGTEGAEGTEEAPAAGQGDPGVRLPVSRQQWSQAAAYVTDEIASLWEWQHENVQVIAHANGDDTAQKSWLAGIGIGLLALLAMALAIFLSHRLVQRLRRLRKETLELSEQRLPSIMDRLAKGERVDMNVDLPPLDFGKDEVGQIADAFNRAQRSAVEAAVTEAETRAGANSVFLNIAHRSQVVVHRQLEVLDKAEYRQEDPEQLELLFQLDHLATRERRNAENLIILGGEMPGRQWRNPVPLLEVVRSAVAETEDYARVRTARLPDDLLSGSVVADIIHLIAELVDNATSFSPPNSTVEVYGNHVGKGVVVEISDQGLGLSPEQLEAINAQLADPPEFGMMGLSKETRLGLFVVGRLAVRTGVRVRLVESEYGGVRAIVLIPTSLLTEVRPHDHDETRLLPNIPQAPGGSDRLGRLDRHERSVGAPDGSSPAFAPVSRAAPPAAPNLEPDWQAAPSGRGTWTPEDGRPALPTRRRQSSLAPQLAEDVARGPVNESTMDEGEIAERSRDLMSAIQQGTTRARAVPPTSSAGFDLFSPGEKRDGNGNGYGGFGDLQ